MRNLKESHNYDHSHNHFQIIDTKLIRYTLYINLSFAILELILALYTNSIALYSNMIHDFGDSIILLTTIFIEQFSFRGRNERYTYGYRRFSLIGAIVNTIILLVGSIVIIDSAINRLIHPEVIKMDILIYVGIIGIFVNLIGVNYLKRSDSPVNRSLKTNLQMDVYNWLTLFIAAIIMTVFNIGAIDAVLSIIIAIIMMISVIKQFKEIFHIIMQSVPDNIDIKQINAIIMNFEGVVDCHDLHIWTLDGEDYITSFHLVVDNKMDIIAIMNLKEEIKLELEKHHLNHTTIEVDNEFQAIKNGELEHETN